MRKLQNWNQFYAYISEALGGVKTRPGDPYEYKVENDHWLAKKKGTQTWYEITGKNFKPTYQKSINILDTEFPDERKDGAPKREVSVSQAWRNLAGGTTGNKNIENSEKKQSGKEDTLVSPTTTKSPSTNTTSTTTLKPLSDQGPVKQDTDSPVINRQYNLPVAPSGLPTIENGYKYKERPSDEDLERRFSQIQGLDEGGLETFKDNCQKIGLPYEIALRQIWAESGFNPKARSSAGAKGLCQFMPSTWNSMGRGNPWNPNDSLRAYFKYMGKILDMFPGRPDLAVSGYNSGENLDIYKDALNDQIAYNDIPREKLKQETRNYTNYILAV